MFLTAVILILFFSLSDLAKWMNQNGATDKQKLFVFGGIFVLIAVIVNLLAIAGAIVREVDNLSFFCIKLGVLMP